MMSAAEAPTGPEKNPGNHPAEVGGETEIADSVVAKIAGIAARRVPGVHSLGSGAAKALGSLRDAIGQTDDSQGVKVTVTGTDASVQVVLTTEYAYSLHEVAAAVRAAVHAALRDWAGLTATDVNVQISDVFAAPDDAETADPEDANSTQP